MAKIDLVDISIRDGNQSLWGATGLNTAQIVQIAPVMDRVGFRALDFNSSTHMAMAVRYKQENPWDLIRLTHAAAPNTPPAIHHDGIPLYLVGDRRSGFHAAGLSLHRAGRKSGGSSCSIRCTIWTASSPPPGWRRRKASPTSWRR